MALDPQTSLCPFLETFCLADNVGEGGWLPDELMGCGQVRKLGRRLPHGLGGTCPGCGWRWVGELKGSRVGGPEVGAPVPGEITILASLQNVATTKSCF